MTEQQIQKAEKASDESMSEDDIIACFEEMRVRIEDLETRRQLPANLTDSLAALQNLVQGQAMRMVVIHKRLDALERKR